MATVKTEFQIPLSIDRAIIAAQDVVEQLKWRVQEIGESRIVATFSGTNLIGVQCRFVAEMRETDGDTTVSVSISIPLPQNKGYLLGILGQFVNGLSLRAQTKSTMINPTVAIGEGQVVSSPASPSRFESLAKLGELHKSGILSDEEFQSEKEKILNSD
jgi:hypothetical protein